MSTTIMRSASTQPGCGLGQSPAPFSLSSSLHLSILSFLSPASPQPAAPACLPPRAAKQLLQLSLLQLFRFSLSSS